MTRIFALVLAAVGVLFVYLAIESEGGISVTQLNQALYYLTVALIAFVNAILFAAADFVEE
ncbi:MAG: hypothetical protein J2P50_10465 [Hyphomicrobiaceae bacterium]|nr:hypothetical protein [Hyphomicrobiaceae bacterium]